MGTNCVPPSDDLLCIFQGWTGIYTLSGFYVGFFVWGEVDPEQKFLSHVAARKKFFRPSGGSEGMLPRKILKI